MCTSEASWWAFLLLICFHNVVYYIDFPCLGLDVRTAGDLSRNCSALDGPNSIELHRTWAAMVQHRSKQAWGPMKRSSSRVCGTCTSRVSTCTRNELAPKTASTLHSAYRHNQLLQAVVHWDEESWTSGPTSLNSKEIYLAGIDGNLDKLQHLRDFILATKEEDLSSRCGSNVPVCLEAWPSLIVAVSRQNENDLQQ